ncbi:aspartate/glutamate racemase family protein [Paenibacillus lemnae]|uniref:Amino acid racemase n=1 Tax=Paenibacillus lemnae TaxID=1330551 RepID=A0A848M3N7_PAELE|nr:amino acid racemase [Paenibacillus lemnae]NMO95206.1 amino acid racemase [Paenibacillus lemnae]
MENKKLGVIGGMGPQATSVFFEKIIENTAANTDQDHINMVILNHTALPDRTKVILEGKKEIFLDAVRDDLKLLELAGVSNIAIPCNTSHYFYEDMQQLTTVNLIHMVDETVKAVYERFGKDSKVGILATNGTISSGIYRTTCEKYGLELLEPDDDIQNRAMEIIYQDVKGLKDVSPAKLEALIHQLVYERQCRCVILACTELSCITLSDFYQECSIDAMDVLVQRSIQLSGKSLARQDDRSSAKER